MDDSKRENAKTKRLKSEVKSALNSYLHNRNYCLLQPFEITKYQKHTYSQIENEVTRANSVLYGCSKSDPTVIDQNFTKFLTWLKEQQDKNLCKDLDQLISPLFCHFYLEILKGDHKDKAAAFCRNHLSSTEKNNCTALVKELINLVNNEGDIKEVKDLFRSKRTVIEVSQESLDLLKNFVLDNGHVVFIQILQNWFDFHIPVKPEVEVESKSPFQEPTVFKERPMESGSTKETKNKSVDSTRNTKIQDVRQAIAALNAEPIPIFCATIGPSKNLVTTGVIYRNAGLVAFAEENALNLMPLNTLDNILNVKDNVERIKFTDQGGSIYSIDISRSNTFLAAGSSDHTVCIYDLNEMKLLHKCEGHLGPIYVVKISRNNEYVVSGSADHTARLWETASGKTLRIFVAHMASILCLDYHPNSLYVVTGSSDRNIRMWCLDKAVTLRLLQGCKANVVSLSFSPAGKYLVSSSEDQRIRIWDLLTSKILLELKYDGAPIYRMIWNKTGRELCTGSNDAVIRIWDLGKMQENEWENCRQHEPIITRKLNGRLLSLDYNFGTYAALTSAEEN